MPQKYSSEIKNPPKNVKSNHPYIKTLKFFTLSYFYDILMLGKRKRSDTTISIDLDVKQQVNSSV